MSARGKPQSDLNVSDLIWRGRWHFNRLTREDAEKARVLFAKALALEPESPEALVHVTWALERSLWVRRGSEAEIAEMGRLARQVINIDSTDSRGYMLAGIAELWAKASVARRDADYPGHSAQSQPCGGARQSGQRFQSSADMPARALAHESGATSPVPTTRRCSSSWRSWR